MSLRFQFAILEVSEFSCVTSGLLEENNINGCHWIITVDISTTASTVFVEYTLVVEKRFKFS